MTPEKLAEIIRLHLKWLRNEEGGVCARMQRADFRGTDLSGALLRGADLSGALFSDVNLAGADFSGANLSGAGLRGTNLKLANFAGANLQDATFMCANVTCANLRGANLRGANLRNADLRDTDLRGADIRDTNLWGCTGNRQHIMSLQTDAYAVTYTADRIQIGCKNYSISEWMAFDDYAIADMDGNALPWWRKTKHLIFAMLEAHPAAPTGAP